MSASSTSRSSWSLARRLLAGLVAGTALGLFLGDRAQPFETVADAFVKLLQMAVLPYVTVSIMGGIGGLRLEQVRRLGLRVALVIVGLWVLALAIAFLMPLTFPPTRNASFFSTTLLDRPAPIDLVDLYIPANPFFALANNVVPAVVLFSIVIGLALIAVPQKQLILSLLEAASDTLTRAMRFVVWLTPYGLFAIAATTAGTLRLEQAERLQIYLAAYAALALLLALWMLPGLVGALTPISSRRLLSSTRDALLTATVAGDVFIVLPLLVSACKELLGHDGPEQDGERTLPDVIVPVSYNFPHSGKLLSLSFVLFAGWFSDAAIDPGSYPALAAAGVVTLFGSVNSAIPFLLDLFRVPADTFQLFVASSVINSRFGTLVAAMHTVTVAILGACAATGRLRWQPRAVFRYVAVTSVAAVAVVSGVRMLGGVLAPPYTGGDVLAGMRIDQRAQAVVLREEESDVPTVAPPMVAPAPASASDRLSAINARGALRVGYLADALPFAFFNGHNELVGLDVALMHHLALELGVTLVFVPVDRHDLDHASGVASRLTDGSLDVVVGGLAMTTSRAELMQLSTTYLDETMAFIVPDDARRRFESWDAIRASGPFTIMVPDLPYYVDKLQGRLPQAHLRRINRIEEAFHGAAASGVDAIALPAERGSAWTLRYPQYSVVVPQPQPIAVPLAYAMPRGQPDLASFVNTWIELKRRDRTIDELYRYWILGQSATASAPRWSIMRDVLKWEKD